MGSRAPGPLPCRTGIWLGLQQPDLADPESIGPSRWRRGREGPLGVQHSEFRILPLSHLLWNPGQVPCSSEVPMLFQHQRTNRVCPQAPLGEGV